MSMHITKKSIRATGSDANGLFIAMMSDESLLESAKSKTGSDQFQKMVLEAITARGLVVPVEKQAESEQLVTVCAKCLTAACWQGRHMCQDSREAGVLNKTVAELRKLNLESECFWSADKEVV